MSKLFFVILLPLEILSSFFDLVAASVFDLLASFVCTCCNFLSLFFQQLVGHSIGLLSDINQAFYLTRVLAIYVTFYLAHGLNHLDILPGRYSGTLSKI